MLQGGVVKAKEGVSGKGKALERRRHQQQRYASISPRTTDAPGAAGGEHRCLQEECGRWRSEGRPTQPP